MKGDAPWAFDTYFRQKWLPAFIGDLKAIEASGFEDLACCKRVEFCLKDVAKTLEAIPNVRKPAPSFAADFGQFAEVYLHWNNKQGGSTQIRQERARAHKSLDGKRDRLGGRIGKSLHQLQNEINWKIMDDLWAKLDAMVNDKLLTGVFVLLGKSLERFKIETKKYRNAN
jgi:hypothetical protein